MLILGGVVAVLSAAAAKRRAVRTTASMPTRLLWQPHYKNTGTVYSGQRRLLPSANTARVLLSVPKTKSNKEATSKKSQRGNMAITQRLGAKEVKLVPNNPAATSIGSSVSRFPLLSNIAQGADIVSQRLGRRIRVKRIRFRGQLLGAQTNSVADDPYNTVRVTVVRCLPGTTFTSYTVNNALDPRFSISAGLLEVLYDRTMVICTPAKDSTGYIAAASMWEFDIKCDIMCEYGSTAAAAPINQEVVIMMTSDSVAVVNPGFAASSTTVVEYIDDA